MTTQVKSKIKIKFNHWLPKLLLKILFKDSTYCAVTLGYTIYYSGIQMYQSLLVHELTHIRQIRKYGILGFYLTYFLCYILNFFQYWNWEKSYYWIPFEQEAYTEQALVFSDYLLNEEYANKLANVEGR